MLLSGFARGDYRLIKFYYKIVSFLSNIIIFMEGCKRGLALYQISTLPSSEYLGCQKFFIFADLPLKLGLN